MGQTYFMTCAVVGSLLATPAFAETACHQKFAFRANPSMGLSAILKLSQLDPAKDAPHTKDGAELVVWPFDQEDHPNFGRYRGLALVFATRHDLGEEAAGGLLLQDGSEPPLEPWKLTVSQRAGAVVLELPARGTCPPFVVKLVEGGAISVQGQVVGRLR